jgi:hypothetical protein
MYSFSEKQKNERRWKMLEMSNLRKDFVVSNLRSQLSTLQGVLKNIEDSERSEDDYIGESLKRVEKNIRQLRKLCPSY